jgi:hypothetical protein
MGWDIFNTDKEENKTMVAYLYKTTCGWELTIVTRPCNGDEFTAGEHIAVVGKCEANRICKARGVKPWNF